MSTTHGAEPLLAEMIYRVRSLEQAIIMLQATVLTNSEKLGGIEGKVTANDNLVKVLVTILIALVTGIVGLAFVVFQNAAHLIMGN